METRFREYFFPGRWKRPEAPGRISGRSWSFISFRHASRNMSRSFLDLFLAMNNGRTIELWVENNMKHTLFCWLFSLISCHLCVIFFSLAISISSASWNVSRSIMEGKREDEPKGPRPIERVLLLHTFCDISGVISEQRIYSRAPFPCLAPGSSWKNYWKPLKNLDISGEVFWRGHIYMYIYNV